MKTIKMKKSKGYLVRVCKEVSHHYSHFVRDSKVGRGVKKLVNKIKGRVALMSGAACFGKGQWAF